MAKLKDVASRVQEDFDQLDVNNDQSVDFSEFSKLDVPGVAGEMRENYFQELISAKNDQIGPETAITASDIEAITGMKPAVSLLQQQQALVEALSNHTATINNWADVEGERVTELKQALKQALGLSAEADDLRVSIGPSRSGISFKVLEKQGDGLIHRADFLQSFDGRKVEYLRRDLPFDSRSSLDQRRVIDTQLAQAGIDVEELELAFRFEQISGKTAPGSVPDLQLTVFDRGGTELPIYTATVDGRSGLVRADVPAVLHSKNLEIVSSDFADHSLRDVVRDMDNPLRANRATREKIEKIFKQSLQLEERLLGRPGFLDISEKDGTVTFRLYDKESGLQLGRYEHSETGELLVHSSRNIRALQTRIFARDQEAPENLTLADQVRLLNSHQLPEETALKIKQSLLKWMDQHEGLKLQAEDVLLVATHDPESGRSSFHFHAADTEEQFATLAVIHDRENPNRTKLESMVVSQQSLPGKNKEE